MDFQKKYSGRLLRLAVVLFFVSPVFIRCANQMAPQGGPKDTLPPVVVFERPDNYSVNFDSKTVYVEFDEYVQLKDQQKEFYTAPFMKRKPTLLIRGRGIQVTIQDTLLENTTYSLNFGSSIQDNNEGNPFHGYRYVFSTGDRIDSAYMSGYTVDAYTRDTVPKTFIFFYEAVRDSIPEYDSVVLNNPSPDYVARAENNGIFLAQNLKPIPYRVYAVEDTNGNQLYDPGIDKIGFLDTIYNPAEMPPFESWFDTVRQYRVADPQVYFRMFKDRQFRRQYLSDATRPLQHKIILNFNADYPQIESMSLNIDSSEFITEHLKLTGDSIALWINMAKETIPDTIRGNIVYFRHDSINNLVRVDEDLVLGWKFFESRQDERERLRKEKEREEAIARGEEPEKEPNPFKVTVGASGTVNPEKDIPFTFDYPLIRIDTAAILLTRREDEDIYRVRFNFQQDTANIRTYMLSAQWQPDQRYNLEIPAGTFTDVAGQTNDTLRAEFTVMDPDKYARLIFHVKGKTDTSQYVLQLLDASGRTIKDEKRHVTTGAWQFNYVDPNPVRLRIIEDINGNGEWDTGNLVERLQPERVEIYVFPNGEEEIATRANWEMEYDVDMNVIFAPVTMKSMMEQINKLEQIRIRKYYRDLQEKEKKNKNNKNNQAAPVFNPTQGFELGR